MNTTNIKIEHLKSGQPRAYADSGYEARISADRKLTRDQALAITKQFVHGFEHELAPDRNPSGFPFGLDSFLEYAKQEDSGSWLVRVVRPYDD